jgi:exosortase
MSDELRTAVDASSGAGTTSPAQGAVAVQGSDGRPLSWVLLTGLLLFIGHLPLLVLYSINLMGREAYQFAPLAVAAALFLVWHRLQNSPAPVEPGSPKLALAILVGAFLILCAATVLWSPWLGMISALVTALGVVWAVGGWALARKLFPGALMLLILLRPPLNLDVEFTLLLRRVAVRCSSGLLDYLGVIHLLSGNVVEVAGHRFFVEDACSGINSVLSVGGFALFYTLWRRRRWWQVVVVYAVTISFVLLGNVIRITTAVALSRRYGVDLLTGWKHQLFGLVLFAVYLGLVVSADAFLGFLTARPEPSEAGPAPAPAGTGATRVAPRKRWAAIISQLLKSLSPRWALGVGIAFAVLALAQTARGWVYHRHHPANVTSTLRADARFSLPEQIGDWKRLDRRQRNVSSLELQAIYSEVWAYQNGRMKVFVALDYPYPGLHDLTVCYHNSGWDAAQKPVNTTDATGKPIVYFEVEMRKKPLTSGYLLFGGFTETGDWAGEDFNRLMQGRFSASGTTTPTATYQVQVLYSSYAPLNGPEKQQVLRLFGGARQLLVQQVLDQLKRKL